MKADLVRARGDVSNEATASEADALEGRPGRRGGKARLVAAAGVLLLGGLLTGLHLWSRHSASPEQGTATSAAALAAVPFENATGDPAWTHLAEGVTDDLARELQRSGVPVKSRESAAQLRGLSDSEIARRLQVDRIARGRISLQGPDILLEAALTQASTGAELWSRKYRQPLDRLGGLYATVAADIAAIEPARLPREPGAAPGHPANFKAYEAYHKGRVYWEQRTREGLLKSIEYFKAATLLDPGYAPAWAGMADAYLALGVPTFGAFRPQEARRLGDEATLKALRLDPDLAEAHASLAFAFFFYDWNWTAAEARFQKAIQLNPQYATAHHWYADYLNAMGRQDEAMQEIRTAFRLEPLSILIHRDFAWHYFFQGNYAAAVAQLAETLKIDPQYAAARSLLGRAFIEQGKCVEGLAELRKAAEDMPRSAALAFIAYGEAAAGQTAKAGHTLERVVALSDREYVSPYYVALVYARLGRTAQALDWLEKGFKEHDTTMVSLNIDPRFDALRHEPRFQALIQKMNFPPKAAV